MADFDQVDFFSDPAVSEDPYPYFEHLRAQCPVTTLPHHGVVAISGWDEASDVYRDPELFSSCNSVIGPFASFPVPLVGDDVGDIIDTYRDQLPMNEHMVTMDPPAHTRERALLMRLITPKRLQENEDFMWTLADRQLDEFVADGRCEFIGAYGQPFAMLVVADLLGVPEAEHERFRQGFGLSANPGELGDDLSEMQMNALGWLDAYFADYIEERRREPRGDVLTELALAKYPDGSTPDVTAVVRTATFLFAAGQETTARLLSSALKTIGDRPEIQQQLRDNRELVPAFIEEMLRLESPIKGTFRLAKVATTIAGTEIPAGSTVMVLPSAANRDPREFESPDELKLDRKNARQHIAFGHGIHTCAGAPLARAEAIVSVQRLFDRTEDIRISEVHHGPAGDRHWQYSPTWMLRGLDELHLEFTPIG